jgi:hypothetical protein
MDARAKMRRVQADAKGYLLKNGFKLVWFIHHTRHQLDIWGLFDGIALRDGAVYFLQVSTAKHGFRDVESYRGFAREHFVSIAYMLWAGRGKWRIKWL